MPRSPLEVDHDEHRYPFCIVWTPIPCITWFLPFVGHMGIATSRGIIRDFAGSYYVSEDEMGFGWPTRIWQLEERMVQGGAENYDSAVRFASDEYKNHVHNIICDNCHSHVALALNEMKYGGRSWRPGGQGIHRDTSKSVVSGASGASRVSRVSKLSRASTTKSGRGGRKGDDKKKDKKGVLPYAYVPLSKLRKGGQGAKQELKSLVGRKRKAAGNRSTRVQQ